MFRIIQMSESSLSMQMSDKVFLCFGLIDFLKVNHIIIIYIYNKKVDKATKFVG